MLGDLDVEVGALPRQDILGRVPHLEDYVPSTLDRDVDPELKDVEGALIDRQHRLAGGPPLQVDDEGPGFL